MTERLPLVQEEIIIQFLEGDLNYYHLKEDVLIEYLDIQAALKELSEKERKVIILYHTYGYTFEEIGSMLNYSESHIRKNIYANSLEKIINYCII